MNFFDSLANTAYSENAKNEVAAFVYDYFSSPKLHNIYLVSKSFEGNSKDLIFLIQKTIELVSEKKDNKNLLKIAKILIYIPKKFPNVPPKFYLEKADFYSIINIQSDINKQTYEILVNSIKDWKSPGQFNNILNDIVKSFSKIYPLYKLEIHQRNNVKYPENSYIPQDAKKVILNDSDINISKQHKNAINVANQAQAANQQSANKININNNDKEKEKEKNNNIFKQLNFNYNPSIDRTNANNMINTYINFAYKQNENIQNFSEEEIKRILVDQTLINVKDSFLSNHVQNKSIKFQIENSKVSTNNKINELSEKIKEGDKIASVFEKLLKEIAVEKGKIKDVIKSSNMQVNFENFRDFIDISDKEERILKFNSMEACIEDMILIIKKAYEKNILKYEEALRYTRLLSKEIFIMNFLKKRLIQ